MSRDETLIRAVIGQGAFATVFQPIFSLETGTLISLEALTRITLGADSSPAWWLAEAHLIGLGPDLELAVLERALHDSASLPAGVTLSVNLSPSALVRPEVLELLRQRPARSVIVELTQRPTLQMHPQLLRHRERFREAGIRLAVGNAAVERANMARLFALGPEVVKTDLWLTAGISTSPARRLLARQLVDVTHREGAQLIAEGIETHAQLTAWQQLGADAAQGYLLATPTSLEEALRTRTLPVS